MSFVFYLKGIRIFRNFQKGFIFAEYSLRFFSNDWALIHGGVYDDATLCNALVIALPRFAMMSTMKMFKI